MEKKILFIGKDNQTGTFDTGASLATMVEARQELSKESESLGRDLPATFKSFVAQVCKPSGETSTIIIWGDVKNLGMDQNSFTGNVGLYLEVDGQEIVQDTVSDDSDGVVTPTGTTELN